MDGFCTQGYCDTTLKEEDCYYYNQFCDETEVWYEEGYCDPGLLQCDSYQDFVEECYYYEQSCSGTEVWYEEGYCNLGSCTSYDDFIEGVNWAENKFPEIAENLLEFINSNDIILFDKWCNHKVSSTYVVNMYLEQLKKWN